MNATIVLNYELATELMEDALDAGRHFAWEQEPKRGFWLRMKVSAGHLGRALANPTGPVYLPVDRAKIIRSALYQAQCFGKLQTKNWFALNDLMEGQGYPF